MKQKKGQDNAQHGGWIWSGDRTILHRQSLFGLTEIPCDNQIRNLLDPIAASTVFGIFKTALNKTNQQYKAHGKGLFDFC